MNAEYGASRRYIYSVDEPPELPADELRELLGGKAASLVAMARDLHLPVPPAFVITSAACRDYMAGDWPAGLDEELRAHMDRLGDRAGRLFGDPTDPLLVSVRSGAAVSMPGMMDTILNLGLNDRAAEGLAAATADPDFAADCLRRFRDGYRDVLQVDDVPDDPWVQLRAAIEAVFRSWHSERARAYRRLEGIPDDLGTAVTVQTMVFGNRGDDSATGVVFTRNPASGERVLYGDLMFNAQGEDVVTGGHEPMPLAVLDERLPEAGEELRRYADALERHHADLCDIEFTIEQGRLWMLQVRVGKRSPRAALRMAIEMADDPDFPLSREDAVRRVVGLLADPPRVFVPEGEVPPAIGVGLPASPGVATGAIVTSSVEAERAAAEGRTVILVRSETSPEDVPGMACAAGVLTARGGQASHAAVVARGWGIPAVVGAARIEVGDREVRIDGHTLAAGETITIDGSTGEVYAGELAGSWQVVPEAATLLEWTAELRIDTGKPVEAAVEYEPQGPAPHESVVGSLVRDDILRALLIKGAVASDLLAEALSADRDRVAELAASLTDDGLTKTPAGTLRLSPQGKLSALALYEADRAAVGEQRSMELLEAFHAFDAQVKEIVTAWQVRETAGEQVLNDHTDADYDGRVLERLVTLHAELREWLAPLAAALRRYAVYRLRLDLALRLASDGDQRYVASPRVDSYHSAWFELHEDLIRLAGRRRSDQAAAGRA